MGLQRRQQTSISININIRFADSNRAGKHGGFKKEKKKKKEEVWDERKGPRHTATPFGSKCANEKEEGVKIET